MVWYNRIKYGKGQRKICMKGFEMKLVAYMQGSDQRFIIPVYQRNYEWKIENCKQLYNDLINCCKKFLGHDSDSNGSFNISSTIGFA